MREYLQHYDSPRIRDSMSAKYSSDVSFLFAQLASARVDRRRYMILCLMLIGMIVTIGLIER